MILKGGCYFLVAFFLVQLSGTAMSKPDSNSAALYSDFPGEDNELDIRIEKTLSGAGYAVQKISPHDLCDHEKITPDRISLLFIPDGRRLPIKSAVILEKYLKSGGNVIALNVPLWKDPVVFFNEKWMGINEYQKNRDNKTPQNLIFDFKSQDLSDWKRSSNNEDDPTHYEVVTNAPAPGRNAFHVSISNLTSWDSLGFSDIETPFKNGATLTVFSAKGGPRTPQLAVEWSEKDGSRWIAIIPLSPEWRQYALSPKDFKYWISNPHRGFHGDSFKPENARNFSVGLAMTHTAPVGQGAHEFYVANIGTDKINAEYEILMDSAEPPALEILSPGYKFFSCADVASLKSRTDQRLIDQTEFPVPKNIASSSPRPKGSGFDKDRSWRWIPLLEAYSPKGEWRGNPAVMFIDGRGENGIWASFAIDDNAWYKSETVQTAIKSIAEKIKNGIFFIDAGANYYTYFEKQDVTLGARVLNKNPQKPENLKARITVIDPESGSESVRKEWDLRFNDSGTARALERWRPDAFPPKGFRILAELFQGDQLIDTVSHDIHLWKPKNEKHFVTIKNGEFMLDGKRWRINGVNYMPSSGIAIEDGEYFEHWISAQSYDPEIIQRDLDHLKDIGVNAVSVFIYYGHAPAQNLLDLLRRLDLLGMKACVSLRPGTPLDFLWRETKGVIEYYKLWENDAVFGYDLAWEPIWGSHEQRIRWDSLWENWIIERYGNIKNAEKDWDFDCPRDEDGNITNPFQDQIDQDGPYRRMVAAYRKFLDYLLYKKYGHARRLIREIDPHHFISFRMAETSNPTYRWEGRMTYDFAGLAAAVDFFGPEAYGRIGSWERAKPGWFVYEYARWANPGNPLVWMEAGVNIWDVTRMMDSETRMKEATEAYQLFYKLLEGSGSDGVFYWWYPGGYRYGEDSDFGIINPDGTDRPITKVIREKGRDFLAAPSAKPADYWIEIDRDLHPEGVTGIYEKVGDEFWNAIDKGYTPGLKTSCTGTNSINCSLIAVGNTPCNGNNPPKFLDAAIDKVMAFDSTSEWVCVNQGGSVKINPDKPVSIIVSATNLGEAEWISPESAKERTWSDDGGVFLIVDYGKKKFHVPITRNVPYLDSIEIKVEDVRLKRIEDSFDIVIYFESRSRAFFGEKFPLTLEPE
ncbi:hypothetical protein JW926_18205 [Candidatus Sumerlaeota bacterium]|nr:hypothetical protein [Candidatus Sumerlaeota bacterium]